MYKEDVIKYYEGKYSKLPKKVREQYGGPQDYLGSILGISQPAVSKWKKVIPELDAMKLQRHTRGRLRYDVFMYVNKR